MTVLDVNNVSKRYVADLVLEHVSFKLSQGKKVGLIGENGCGKSTLLKMIAGIEDITAGTITRPRGSTVGYLAQELEYDENHTVYQEILQVFREVSDLGEKLKRLEQAMADPAGGAGEQQRVLDQYSRLRAEFERRGGYDCDYRMDAVLEGLGLSDRKDQPVASLSGGEKNIVALAKILLEEPDILLLDEPANHLDFEGLDWLETFLQNYDKTVVLVSHNRYLLDRVVHSVLELEERRLVRYAGNYSAYRAAKMRNLLKQRAAYEDQLKEIRRLEEMIKRYELWASMTNDPRQARRARNKQRMLDRMEKIERPNLDRKRIDPRFDAAGQSGHIALEVKAYTKSFDDRVLFDRVDLHLSSGERVGLLGANGTGKSTLFKDIVGQGAWDNPVLRIGPRIRIGYYAQEHETLNPEHSIMRELQQLPGVTKDRAFTALSRFLFRWEDMDQKIATLSGGEKSRVQLAKLMFADVNFLLLDEPTNHLDIFSREQVEEALEEFDGTILVISHDRYFLDRIVDRIVEIDNPGLREYPGDFTYFWQQKKASAGAAVKRQKKRPPAKKKTPISKPSSVADAREIEEKIERLEAQKLQLEQDLAAAYRTRDYKRGDKLAGNLRRLESELEQLYEIWEQVSP